MIMQLSRAVLYAVPLGNGDIFEKGLPFSPTFSFIPFSLSQRLCNMAQILKSEFPTPPTKYPSDGKLVFKELLVFSDIAAYLAGSSQTRGICLTKMWPTTVSTERRSIVTM